MMAFTSGWLENESIWLHMSYKWYLELLRAGLYAQFFKEIQNGVVCFMNTKVFGRSPLEASSFIVSSAFPDKALHGSGFLARLSGTTAEFLSMWNHMMVGPTPFTTDAKGALQLSLAPVIASWMWREDGTLLTKFLGSIQLTYVMKAKKNSWDAKIKSYDIEGDGGTALGLKVRPDPPPSAQPPRLSEGLGRSCCTSRQLGSAAWSWASRAPSRGRPKAVPDTRASPRFSSRRHQAPHRRRDGADADGARRAQPQVLEDHGHPRVSSCSGLLGGKERGSQVNKDEAAPHARRGTKGYSRERTRRTRQVVACSARGRRRILRF
jgi:hypothetical protein